LQSLVSSTVINNKMIFREATIADIPQMEIVRNSVTENALSRPDLITSSDYKEYLQLRGKGWVCLIKNEIVGFAIVDLKEHNVWALFVKPENKKTGIGKELHRLMLDWYFNQTQETIWLSTALNTRAETFYKLQGWAEAGAYSAKEIKLIMTYEDWLA
jgi:GNAT superfamily N-acetyltransferase